MAIADIFAPRSHDERLRSAQNRLYARLLSRRGKRPGGEAGEAVPIDPHRPLDLSGGAAAALDFES